VKPSSPAQNAFNNAARAVALDSRALSEIRDGQAAPGAPGISSYTVNYDVRYLDPRLAAVVFTIDTFGAGAAHPNSFRESLIFDLSHGRKLTLADVLGAPAEAVPAISELCRTQLKAQADKEDWQLFDDADFPAVVRELAHWAPDKDGVNILFDQYSVAAYAFGPHECRLSWSDLKPWLKPESPLPPQ
jgi:hypothetical protein